MPERVYQSSARKVHDHAIFKTLMSLLIVVAFASPMLIERMLQPPRFVPEQSLREIELLNPAFMQQHFPRIQVDGCGLEYSPKYRDYVYVGTNVVARLIPTTGEITLVDIGGNHTKRTEVTDWSLGTTTKIDSNTNRTMYYYPHDATWRDFERPADHTISR